MLTILSGLVAGVVHVFSGPDHLAALAPISFSSRGKAWLAGLKWGLGHTSGVLLIGILVLLVRESLPLQFLSSISERMVGVVLIAIGVWGVRRAHSTVWHEHEHGVNRHEHMNLHDSHAADSQRHDAHTHTAFAIGLLHGLAGSAHLLGILPALALPINWAIVYLLAFGAGSIFAMIGFAWLTGALSAKMQNSQNGYRYFLTGLSAMAIVIGCVWLAL